MLATLYQRGNPTIKMWQKAMNYELLNCAHNNSLYFRHNNAGMLGKQLVLFVWIPH